MDEQAVNGVKELEKHIETVDKLIGPPTSTAESGIKQLTVARAAVDLIADGHQPAKGIAERARNYLNRTRARFLEYSRTRNLWS